MNYCMYLFQLSVSIYEYMFLFYRRALIEKLWKQMRPDKPLRPDTGEVSTATVLKVLGNRALSSRFNFKPLLRGGSTGNANRNGSGAPDQQQQQTIKPVVKGTKDLSQLVKPDVRLRFNSPIGDDRDRRKLMDPLNVVIDRKDDHRPSAKNTN